VRSTGPQKLGRKRRGKGERGKRRGLRDISLHHEGAACSTTPIYRLLNFVGAAATI